MNISSIIFNTAVDAGQSENKISWNKVFGVGGFGVAIFALISFIDSNTKSKELERKQKLDLEKAQKQSDLRIKEMDHQAMLKERRDQQQDERKQNNMKQSQEYWKERQACKASKSKQTDDIDNVEINPTAPYSLHKDAQYSKTEYLDARFFPKGGFTLLSALPGLGKTCFYTQTSFHLCGMDVNSLFGNKSSLNAITPINYDYEMTDEDFNTRYGGKVNVLNYRRNYIPERSSEQYNVYSHDYLVKQMKEDLEYVDGDVLMSVDNIGELTDVCEKKNVAQDFIAKLRNLRKDYHSKTGYAISFLFVQHINPNKIQSSKALGVGDIKGTQYFNQCCDQTILMGNTCIKGCVLVKIGKGRQGGKQDGTAYLFKHDDVFFDFLGEYNETDILPKKNGSKISLCDFLPVMKSVSVMDSTKQNGAGRPTMLTRPICLSMLNTRSKGQGKIEVCEEYGFTRQAYNEALVRYGFVDDYPLGNWKP